MNVENEDDNNNNYNVGRKEMMVMGIMTMVEEPLMMITVMIIRIKKS